MQTIGSTSGQGSTQTPPSEIWEATCRMLEEYIVPGQVTAWIRPLEIVEIQDKGAAKLYRIGAPNDFSINWIKDHHKRTIENVLAQVTGTPAEISVFLVEKPGQTPLMGLDPEPPTVSNQDLGQRMGQSVGSASGVVLQVQSRSAAELVLEPKYHFATFVVGASNQFAHASAVAVAEHPGRQYNPLFLYSPPGLGKTHLLHAIGNHVLAKNPQAHVAYLSAERFVNELIDCLQHRRMAQFRQKYRDSYDLILIDDIQFIAGKTTSEEEFFHTFNALHSSKRQIVVTSDRPPKEIAGLEERVRTRFEWGLVADITPPEIETRIAILKAKAERDDIYLPDEAATFLATHVKSNVRELEGVLIRLQAQASLSGAEISLEMVKQELRNVIPEEGAHITIDAIQNAVSKHFQIKPIDLRSTTRARTVALPRQIAMYLIRKYTGIGVKEIGQYFGGRDHTTVLHACKKIEEEVDSQVEIREAVEGIQNLL